MCAADRTKTFQWILALKVEEQEEQTWLDRKTDRYD